VAYGPNDINNILQSVGKLTTLHYNNIVYLQRGGGNYFRQNDVAVTPFIDNELNSARSLAFDRVKAR